MCAAPRLLGEAAHMDENVSAAQAHREFFRLLQNVREGRAYLVTLSGKPIARIVPSTGTPGAREALYARLQKQAVARAGQRRRDELYDDS